MIPSGAGICAPLEGGFACADVMRLTGAAWAVDYQPVTACTAMVRAHDYQPQADDGSVSGAWWDRIIYHRENPTAFTLLLNEPHSSVQDNWDAAYAAHVIREDWLERTTVDASNLRYLQMARYRSASWAGFGCIGAVESGRRWERDYKAAGGAKPPYFHAHFGATSGTMLRDSINGYLAHLDALWGVSVASDVILSEVWTPPGATAEQALDVLRGAFEVVRTQSRIKAWAWFSARYDDNWRANDLLRADGSLTALGVEYQRLVGAVPFPGELKPVGWFPVARK